MVNHSNLSIYLHHICLLIKKYQKKIIIIINQYNNNNNNMILLCICYLKNKNCFNYLIEKNIRYRKVKIFSYQLVRVKNQKFFLKQAAYLMLKIINQMKIIQIIILHLNLLHKSSILIQKIKDKLVLNLNVINNNSNLCK